MYVARDAFLYNARPLLEVIQLMSMQDQDMKRTFVCASSCIKHYVQPSYGCCGTPVVVRMCVYTVRKKYFFNT